jgi:hypothetical protein
MGYWEEKNRYEKIKANNYAQIIALNKNNITNLPSFGGWNWPKIFNCTLCGKQFKLDKKENKYKWVNCQGNFHWAGKGLFICEQCAKKCKKCKRYYCPKHTKKHKCC